MQLINLNMYTFFESTERPKPSMYDTALVKILLVDAYDIFICISGIVLMQEHSLTSLFHACHSDKLGSKPKLLVLLLNGNLYVNSLNKLKKTSLTPTLINCLIIFTLPSPQKRLNHTVISLSD